MLHVDPRPETPTADLVREALLDAKELLQAEVELARDELRLEIRRAKASAFALAAAAGALLLGVVMLIVGVALAIHTGPLPALLFGAGFVVIGAIAGVLGFGRIPRRPLIGTRARLRTDVRLLKERVA
ncbi:MAG: phage holin family protein [Polyangiaceae bacterium]|nr:phage holin family protein [Polyangiaceae bacterium]